MDIKLLEYFVKISEEKSISKVAEFYYISQPALSLQIKKLEELYGHKLFTRNIKGVDLTEAGKILLTYSKNILQLYSQSLEELNRLHNSHQSVRIDANITLATYALPCMIFHVKSLPKFKDYYLDLTFSTVNSVENNILDGISDLGYVHNAKPNPGLVHYEIGHDRLVLAASSTFDIPKKISLEELKSYHLIEAYDKFQERLPLETSMSKYGYHLQDFHIAMTLHSTESVKTALFKGFGTSFLPYSSVKKEIQEGQLKEVLVTDFQEDYPVYLVYLKENENNPRLALLIKHLKKIKNSQFC
ncbi:LysR family transcriptional regulator [Sinanaerobacter chloroacetimidivorans]|uniref:LysR family transcriptional regulator n=1 Tax=Sinanaerobacter chloroacetimidivorans TaxID=2818044 RepID=A0A8J7W2Y0_9FIRM|nr:LysR family transcriptional regulator [Sinanaerobacter chloroacetimidivorans]MBR0597920.1 LysR family transcriptional regulator [Sinanaerobacter chloroacetimidivorans]